MFGDAEGIGVVDETGFLKKGNRSVGVKRQYSGTAGKIENCQMGTFLSYATPKGTCFWIGGCTCRRSGATTRASGSGQGTRGSELSDQARASHGHVGACLAAGVPMRWVTGDEVYGDATELRDLVAGHEPLVCAGGAHATPVWAERPAMGNPNRGNAVARGARCAWRRRRPGDDSGSSGGHLARAPLAAAGVAEGEKGCSPMTGRASGSLKAATAAGPEAWLLARRSVSDPTEMAYYLSNAPADTPLLKLAQVAATRYTVEQCIEEAKGETGLDEYEVRYWHSWHRHITLSMMAHAWLASIRRKATAKKGA